jgi:hypothetical protein|nr:MAG TPA: hypothetical protein [Siphoviridae sp. ctKRf14]
MGKLYTLDGKLLTESPEIRIGEKIYPVDNRQKTVAKLQETIANQENPNDLMAGVANVLALALGEKAAQEVENMNMPYPAYQQLFELVIAAVTGEDPEEVGARFPGKA